jgi:hypothetical protein
MIGGFIIGGDKTKQVVIRAIGPSLSGLGVTGALADPTLELRSASGTLISANDNWANDSNAGAIQAANLAPTSSSESALLATLNPGNYTAIVRGVNNGIGVALVELYDLSPPPNQ